MNHGDIADNRESWRNEVEHAFRTHSIRVSEMLRGRFGSVVVEDALQEVFSQFLAHGIPKGIGVGAPISLPYLLVCVRHQVQRAARKAQRAAGLLRRAALGDSLAPALAASDRAGSARASVNGLDRFDHVERALARLPQHEREAIFASVTAVGGESESAERLGCTANCAAVRRHRAIAHLRELLGVADGAAGLRSTSRRLARHESGGGSRQQSDRRN